jgi:hypothetical protein
VNLKRKFNNIKQFTEKRLLVYGSDINLWIKLLTLISKREGKANSFSLKYVFSHSKGNSRAGCIRINDMSKCMYIVHCTLVHYTTHAYIANMHKVRQIYLTEEYTALPAQNIIHIRKKTTIQNCYEPAFFKFFIIMTPSH